MNPVRSAARSFLYLFATIVALAWLTGLVNFIARIQGFTEPPLDEALQPTEAVVVLTGGSDRLSTGLQIMVAGKAKKLLVSGVYPGLTLDKVLNGQSASQQLRDCCISLGYAAADTTGNALETRQWLEAEGFHSLRLVTANYHMPRSLLLFREVMPDVAIIPHPVVPENVKLNGWWLWPGSAMLLATEYDKYLVAGLRIRLKALL